MLKDNRRFEKCLLSPMLIWTLGSVVFAIIFMFSLSMPLSNYLNLIDKVYLNVLLRTLKLSILTVAICFILAYPFAYYLAGLKSSVRNILFIIFILPMCTNALIRIYGWRIILIKLLPGFLYSDGAVLLGMVYGLFPLIVLPLYNAATKMPLAPIEAAENLGANKFDVTKNIIIPMMMPSVITGCILVFIPSMGLFFLNDLLGGSKSVIAGSLIQNLIHSRNISMAAAVAVVLLLLTLIFIAIYNKALSRDSINRSLVNVHKDYTGLLGKIYVIVLTIILYLPSFVVILYSFNSNTARVPIEFTGFTLNWYVKLFTGRNSYGKALLLSILVALIASIFAVVIGSLAGISYSRKFSNTKESILDKAFDYISTLPIMLPEVILGLAYMMIFNKLGIKDNLLRLVLAHLSFCVPYVFLSVKSAMKDCDMSIMEAASNLGASKVKVLKDIVLPQCFDAIISGFVLAFVMSLDDFIISYFVYLTGDGTLPMLIYSSVKTGVSPQLNALCTLIVLVIFIVMIISFSLIKYREGKHIERKI